MPVFSLKPRPAGLAPMAASVLLFALLCAVLAYWGMLLFAPRAPLAPVASILDQRSGPDLGAASGLFGIPREAVAVQAASATNIQVVGVAASQGNGSAAILTVEGKPARAYAVGERVAEGVRLVAVGADKVTLERAGARFDLKAPARSSLDILTSGVGRSRDTESAFAPPVPLRPAGTPPAGGFAAGAVPPPGGAKFSGPPPGSPGAGPGTAATMPAPSSAVMPAMPMPGAVTGVIPPDAGAPRPPASPDGAAVKP